MVNSKQRPLNVWIVGLVYVAAGAVGLIYHAKELALSGEGFWIALLRLVAVVIGIFLLLGKNWARWLALAWMAFHVVISFYNSAGQSAVHAVILALITLLLFRKDTREWFLPAESNRL